MKFILNIASDWVFLSQADWDGSGRDLIEEFLSQLGNSIWMRDFIKQNESHLVGLYGLSYQQNFKRAVDNEVALLKAFVRDIKSGKHDDKGLDVCFLPFRENGPPETYRSRSKWKAPTDSKLKFIRVYGVRLDERNYVITGVALKVTFEMDSSELKSQKERMLDCVKILKENNISTSTEFENKYLDL